MWPYNVLEKSPVYRWIKTIVLMVIAPGLGTWLLLNGETKSPIDYGAAFCLLAMGLICWVALVAGIVRRVRTGKWDR